MCDLVAVARIVITDPVIDVCDSAAGRGGGGGGRGAGDEHGPGAAREVSHQRTEERPSSLIWSALISLTHAPCHTSILNSIWSLLKQYLTTEQYLTSTPNSI